jgi:hypothetical protein
MSVPLDTTAAAADLQLQAYRAMGAAERLKIAFELSDLTHALAVTGIRRLDPECSEEEARRRLAERLYGTDRATRR